MPIKGGGITHGFTEITSHDKMIDVVLIVHKINATKSLIVIMDLAKRIPITHGLRDRNLAFHLGCATNRHGLQGVVAPPSILTITINQIDTYCLPIQFFLSLMREEPVCAYQCKQKSPK